MERLSEVIYLSRNLGKPRNTYHSNRRMIFAPWVPDCPTSLMSTSRWRISDNRPVGLVQSSGYNTATGLQPNCSNRRVNLIDLEI